MPNRASRHQSMRASRAAVVGKGEAGRQNEADGERAGPHHLTKAVVVALPIKSALKS